MNRRLSWGKTVQAGGDLCASKAFAGVENAACVSKGGGKRAAAGNTDAAADDMEVEGSQFIHWGNGNK